MTDQELREAIREARAREAVDPHRIEAEERDRTAGPFVACACGRTFLATTFGRAAGSWRRHRVTEERHAAEREEGSR